MSWRIIINRNFHLLPSSFARFETSSTTMIFCLHLLAHHQDIQSKARESIKEILVKYDGNWSYDAVMEMSFLEQIIEGGKQEEKRKKINGKHFTHLLFSITTETLRLYPPVSDIHRWVSKNYRLPNGSILPKETAVIIPALAFSRDPDLFPNPMQFDPSRFSSEAKAARHPFSTMPFGEGNRICLGLRFGCSRRFPSSQWNDFFPHFILDLACFKWNSGWACCWRDSNSMFAQRQTIQSKLILWICFTGQLEKFSSIFGPFEYSFQIV